MGSILTAIGAYFTGLPSIVQGMIISFGINKVAEELGMYDQDINVAGFDRGIKTNNTKNTHPIPVIYGERIVGGSEYRSIEGTNNKFLHRVMCLGEGEIDSVKKVFLNNKDISTISEYIGLVTTEVKTGQVGQSFMGNLVSQVPAWDTTMVGNQIAYIHVRLEYDRDVFSGIPRLTCLVKGKKVYDPRESSHSQTNTLTWEWSDNPVLCILDYLTNTVYGRGIPYDQIDLETFKNEADYCDASFNYLNADGSTISQKRYTCNGVLNPDETALNNLKKLCSSCRAVIIPPSDKYRIVIDREATASFTFNEENIIGSLGIKGGSLREKKNQARVRFFDKNNNYDEAIHVTSSSSFVEEDANQLLTAELLYPFTNSYTRANYLSHLHIKSSREHWKVAFTATSEALSVQVMDVVNIKSSAMGWNSGSLASGKKFRITHMEFMPDDTIEIQAEEYDPSVYTPSLDTPPSIPDSSFPNPFNTKPVTNLVCSSAEADGGLAIANDGTLISRIRVTWDAPALAFVNYYEVHYVFLGGGANQAFQRHESVGTTFYISPVADGTPYLIKVIAVFNSGLKSDPVFAIHVPSSKSAKPIRPASLSFSVGREFAQVLTFEPNTIEKDVAGYKIKYEDYVAGDTIATLENEDAWSNMSNLHEGLITNSPYETNLLSQGVYNFGIKTVDTSGNESESAMYVANAEVENSPIKNILEAFYPRLDGWLNAGSIGSSSAIVDDVTGDIETVGATLWSDLTGVTWASASSWDHGGSASQVIYETNGNFFTDGTGSSIALSYRPKVQISADGTAVIEYAYSSDGSSFGSFSSTVATVKNKGIKVRVTLTGEKATLSSLAILLDGRGIEEEVLNGDTSTFEGSTGVRKIGLANSFSQVRQVQATFVGNFPSYSFHIADKTSLSSGGALAPTINIYDASGNPADATMDFFVKGY